MTSAIDPTKPEEGNAYTADVRSNFARAADEISSLQDRVDALETALAMLQAQASGSVVWPWAATPQRSGPPIKPSVGVDTADPTLATLLTITAVADNGTDYSTWLGSLVSGDGIMIWQGANQLRYAVTGSPTAPSTGYLQIAIALDVSAGVEPADGSDVNVNLLFSPRGGAR